MATKPWEIPNECKFIRAAISLNRTMVTVRGRGYTITAYNFKMKAGL
jgi:hypothetical protein